MFRTARLQLVAWNLSLLATLLVALSLAVYIYFSTTIYREVDQQLVTEQQRMLAAMVHEGSFYPIYNMALPYSYRIDVVDMQLRWVASTACPIANTIPSEPACPPDQRKPVNPESIRQVRDFILHTPIQQSFGASDVQTSTVNGDAERSRTFPYFAPLNPNQILLLQISRSVQAEQVELQKLARALILGVFGSVVAAALISLFLANKSLIPIREAFARQRQFTADASHELRTPLSLIRLNAEMLERRAGTLPAEDADLPAEIIREADHLNRLVGDLLTLARADAGTIKIHEDSVDFRALVAEVHDDVHRIAESRGICSELNLDGPVQVTGDAVRLRQLVLILMDNALKYTDSGGAVTVALERQDGRAHLVVRDTGIGIPPDDLPHIFDRFYRVDRAREHESGGTGLGLAIAQWIVQAHRGSIGVVSRRQQGTEFSVYLPAATT